MVLGGTTLMGFGSAFNMVYGPQIEEFTGIRMSWYTSLLIAETEFDFQDVVPFLPWPFEISLFGNFLMLAYVLLEVIILINLLVAMMGTTYDKVSEEKEQQFHLSRGAVLSHYETYAFLPPPLNVVQAILYFMFWLIRFPLYPCRYCLSENKKSCKLPKMEWELLGRQAEKQKALIYKLVQDELKNISKEKPSKPKKENDENEPKNISEEEDESVSDDCTQCVKNFFGSIKNFFVDLWDSIYDNLGVSDEKQKIKRKRYRQTILRYQNAICFHIKLHNNDLEIEKEVKDRAVPKDWQPHEEVSDKTNKTREKRKNSQGQGNRRKSLGLSSKRNEFLKSAKSRKPKPKSNNSPANDDDTKYQLF